MTSVLELMRIQGRRFSPVQVIQAEAAPGGQQRVIALDQSQLSGSQVYVALTDTEGGAAGSEIVAVNMEDLLDGTVTFICGESQ